jgi:isoleucyl-tRNA synthetase
LLISMRPLDGYQVQREGMHAVALDVELDDALRSEGVVRDIVRAVQNARQSADFAVTDRITLTLDGDLSLLDAVRTHEAYLAGEVLAVAVAYADLDGTVTPLTIDGRTLKISIAVVDVRARSAGDDEDQPDDREHA